MPDWLRRAGRGRDADGWWVTWSVAEGNRGRRWREVRSRDAGVASSLLLETDPTGRFTHLELSTSSGLLTLHPEGDGTLHGNAVVAAGVEHVRGLAWDAEGIVLVEGSTICRAAAAKVLERARPMRSASNRAGVSIPLNLALADGPIRVERIAAAEWRFDGGWPIRLDAWGLPQLDEGESWPLEG